MYSSCYFKASSNLTNISFWLIISVVLAIVGQILVYFLFINKKNLKF